MADQTNAEVSDERLRELDEIALEAAAKALRPDLFSDVERERHQAASPMSVNVMQERYRQQAASTVTAYLNELNRRSVTSQASEGEHPDDFAVGMAVAAGIAISAHGAETVAEEILRAGNLDTLKAMRAAGVDRYDIRLCLPVLKHIRDKFGRRQALGGRS